MEFYCESSRQEFEEEALGNGSSVSRIQNLETAL